VSSDPCGKKTPMTEVTKGSWPDCSPFIRRISGLFLD
jgi:hypothetical protein